MKNLVRICVCLFAITVASAQEKKDIATSMVTLSDLITHVADTYPATTPQQLYILVEVDASGVQSDMRFYLEQGLGLLRTRLQPEDRIAIGTYGAFNKTVLPFTDVKSLLDIPAIIQQLSTTETTTADGIDIAFNVAQSAFNPKAENRVLMIRNDLIQTGVANNTPRQKNEKQPKTETPKSSKIGGAIALTALSILPEVLEIIKN